MINVVNKIGEDKGIQNRIHFCNIYKESTLDDLYGNIESQDDSSCVSDESWDMPKNGGKIDHKNVVYNDAVNHDEINDLDNKTALHLNDGLANNNNNNNNNNDNNNIESVRVINQQDKEQNHSGTPNTNLQP